MNGKIKEQIEQCKTKRQVIEILKKNNIQVVRDNSDEVGCFSVWLDDFTRIYKPVMGNMKVQKWRKVDMNYSGVPTFFSNNSYF